MGLMWRECAQSIAMSTYKRVLTGLGTAVIGWIAVRHVLPPEVIETDNFRDYRIRMARHWNIVVADYVDMWIEKDGRLMRQKKWFMWRQKFEPIVASS